MSDGSLVIRPALASDVPALRDIYNQSILKETASFDLEPVSLENRMDWFYQHKGDFIILVALWEGEIAGYASLSRFNPKPAYDITAEFSLYVGEKYRRKGSAWALANHMLAIARKGSLSTVVSLITADNTPSLELHRRLGFQEIGVLHRCGVKFGRTLDVAFFEIDVRA